MKFSSFFAALLSIVLFPLVSAYNGYGGLSNYLRSPWEIIQNPWIFFALVFALFFAITYFAVGKTITNKGPATVISLVIALFIAATISQRSWYYGYFGEGISSWFIAGAIILGFILIAKLASNLLGGWAILTLLFLGWFLVNKAGVNILPYELFNTEIYNYYQFLASPTFLTILVIATALVLVIAYAGKGGGNKAVKDWLWGKKKEGTKIIFPG
jgi:hypothetical protein